ncbi:hypothetical protein BASA81_002684 [Batrachochytrium salamandrivorans]|nr:hypothetical protein BASA81_002684 [Batrachochytrium salamandrivorans]
MRKHSNSPVVVNEDYKIRISRLVEEFRSSEDQTKLLPDLDNHERRYIHDLAKGFGLKTKSSGKEPNRVLTLSKPQIKVLDSSLPVEFPDSVKRELAQYFAHHPMTPNELALELKVDHRIVNRQPPSTIGSNSTIEVTTPPPILSSRMQLPVWQHREEICQAINDHDITIVSGETGSGKSTQVVQYLLDQFPENKIVCTQPRRLPCISLATRVCEERGLLDVGQQVGYSVRFDNKYHEHKTRLLFCTTGVALMKLQSQTSNLFTGITHLVLDEIHDRDANSDFLLVFCREILAKRQRLEGKGRVKIVLMSATLKIDSFRSYFADFSCASVQVEGRSFPVDAYFLEDVLRFTRLGLGGLGQEDVATVETEEQDVLSCPSCHLQFNPICEVNEFALHVATCASSAPEQLEWINPWADDGDEQTVNTTPSPTPLPKPAISMQMMVEEYLLTKEDENEVDLDLIVRLVETIAINIEYTSVLIFLPGWFEITTLVTMLETHPILCSKFTILPLHSGISSTEQWRVFDQSIRNKIICSTNIAETSITIPDVEYVIDTCLVKEKGYDPQTKSSSLQSCFISRSSALQRRGRAGRCFHGTCFHLVSRQRFNSLLDFQVPEMLRTPLEQICLQARAIVTPHDFPSIAEFLSRAMDPPNEQTVANAMDTLIGMGALTRSSQELTGLGRILSTLPLEPKLGKMLLMACFLECLDSALTLAVSSGFRDPFVLDSQGTRNAGKAFLAKSIPQLGSSDHVAMLASVRGFERQGRGYCQRYSLSPNVLSSIVQMKRQVRQQLTKFLPQTESEHVGQLQALICSGTVPNLAIYYNRQFVSGKHTRIRLHNSSSVREENNSWYAFEEMVRNHRGSCLCVVTKIDPLLVLLFAGGLNVRSSNDVGGKEDDEEDRFRVLDNGVVSINAWARIQCESEEIALQLAVLRLRLETSLLNAVERGNFTKEDRHVAKFVNKLIAPRSIPSSASLSSPPLHTRYAPKTPLRPKTFTPPITPVISIQKRDNEPSSALSTRPITVHALQFLKLYLLRDRRQTSCSHRTPRSEHHERALRGERAPGNERRQACHAAPQAGTPRVPSCSIWSGNVLHPRRATSTSSPTPCRQTGSRARCCGTRRAPEKKKRLARKRELLALPKDLKRVRPEPSAKRAELYVAPTGSSERVVGVDPGKSDLISSGTGPVLGWGDWGRGSQMKFLEPTKGVGMRKLFSRAGYEVVLVDEFRTSCTCFGCEGGACEKFRSVMNPRSWMRETYGPAKRAAQVQNLRAAVEQGPQRVAQHHAVRPGGETGRPEAILHDQKLQ